MKKNNAVYMKVTQDKYELPIFIADSVNELAEICGVKSRSIRSCMSHFKTGINNNCCYIKVEFDEGDEE